MKYLMENLEAAKIDFDEEEIREIESAVPLDKIRGERYTEAGMAGIEN